MATEAVPLVYRPAELGRLLKVSTRKVYLLLESGEIRSFKTSANDRGGGARLIPASAVQEYIERKLAKAN